MITGDRYSNCEPHLATYCCKCENDNLAIFFHKVDAKKKFGVKDFSNIPETSRGSGLYDRELLEKHMLERYGSKLGWLREIAAQDATRENVKGRKPSVAL
ncbi:hypothetical protein F442_19390 [Phytophthora nicotianae P10297]|uniref:Uncharacterized protein n=1 Tax=Phytophthora nicotianae P10297 TaxID=1317064 RepID=W2YAX8_PHYNI|nr:hypothetical protein F442_19390 [Phytophthora nicotianae P10297]